MSGLAIKGSLPISGNLAKIYAQQIIDDITVYSNNNILACMLGSTGKKPIHMTSGDIDIAVQLDFSSDNVELMKDFIYKTYGIDTQIYTSNGFKILSFGYKYKFIGETRVVQVDLMFTTNLNYSKFMYHSPNYSLKESNFKGLYRTNLLVYAAGRIPTGISDKFDEDGNLTDYWKYTLTYDNGLVLTHKTYTGKTKRLMTPVTVKEDTLPITKNVEDIIKYVLGPDATIDDTNSFESLITYILSDKYIYGNEVRRDILHDYLMDSRQDDRIDDIVKYIVETMGFSKLKNAVIEYYNGKD